MITKEEIENKLKGMSDFLKIEYLEKIVKENVPTEIKKFAHKKISELYAEKKMYKSAAENMDIVAGICITFKEKIEAYIKEAKLLIFAEDYEEAEKVINKALSNANSREKEDIKDHFKEVLRRNAEMFEEKGLKMKAIKVYKKLLELGDENARKKLALLNEKIGKIDEANKYKI